MIELEQWQFMVSLQHSCYQRPLANVVLARSLSDARICVIRLFLVRSLHSVQDMFPYCWLHSQAFGGPGGQSAAYGGCIPAITPGLYTAYQYTAASAGPGGGQQHNMSGFSGEICIHT